MERAKLMQFVQQIETAVPDLANRNRVAALAIAVAIAYSRHLPSMKVESSSAYFIEQVSPQVYNLVSEFNEGVVVDTEAVCEYVRKFWQARYYAAYPGSVPVYHPDHGFLTACAGFNGQFSVEDIGFFECNAQAVLTLAASASFLIEEAKVV